LFRVINNSVIKTIRRALTLAPIPIVLASLVLQTPQLACAQTATDEYKVKAAFLFHFAQLVDWPADAFNSRGQSFNVCVFDDEPHLRELQSALEGKPIGTRVVHVRVLPQAQPVQGCSILFLGRDEGWRQTGTLRVLHGQPVLTVGESNNFLSEGGIIRLHIVQNKVRFDINVGVADSSHLKISSRLLLLASSVALGDQAKGGQ
jgi:hypothetical protein